MRSFITRFVQDEDGQDLIEYAMLAAFIALVCVVAVQGVGGGVVTTFEAIEAAVNPIGGIPAPPAG